MADLAAAVATIVAEAGVIAAGRLGTGFETTRKADGSPVSTVDYEIDRFLHAKLTALLPDAGWLSEETDDDPARLACARVWVVDPIDGTRDFVRGRAGWAISVALVDHGRPVIAVLDAPARGERWSAVAGGGAYCNGAALRAGDRRDLAGARISADAPARADRDRFVVVAKPNSIALRVAMVAADEADLVATMRWGAEWDIAAAVLVATEAGAIASDARGAPLAFNQPSPRAFGIIAAAAGIHTAAVDRLAPRVAAALAAG